MKRATLTVGIPAFNEEKNISFLVNDLLKQSQGNFFLKKIIISSDGSTDKIVLVIKKIKNSKVVILDNKDRKGQAFRQNQIIKKTDSDILVLLNADVFIKDAKYLEKLVNPIIKDKADLTSAAVEELPTHGFLESVLEASMKYKKLMFETYKKGNNIYTCHGRNRAFSKRLYKAIKFNDSVGEDAYSFLFCKYHNFKYAFVKNTKIYYKLPGNFRDHEKQSIRFFKSQGLFGKEFGKEFVKSENYLSPVLIIQSMVKYFFINPLIAVYFFMALFLKIKSYISGGFENAWSASSSSKVLRS